MSKNPKKLGKLTKIANIDREFFHIFWMTRGNSMKCSRKMCFKITLNVTKNESSKVLYRRYIFQKVTGAPGRLGLNASVADCLGWSRSFGYIYH